MGAHHERAREGHALLLAAGELHGIMIAAIEQTHAVEQLAGAVTGIALTSQVERQEHVLLGGQGGNQLIGLKHESDGPPAQHCELVLFETGDVGAIEQDLAGCGRIEAGEQAEQRALTAARAPMMATNWPRSTSKSMPFRISTVWVPVSMRFDTWRATMAALLNWFDIGPQYLLWHRLGRNGVVV